MEGETRGGNERVGARAPLCGLARRTSTGRYIPEIDGLRFVSIGLVLLFHVAVLVQLQAGVITYVAPFGSASDVSRAYGPVSAILSQGNFGVELFFIVSGFVLALPFVAWRLQGGREVILRCYLIRRLTRIEPPYVVVLTLLFALEFLTVGGVRLSNYLAGLGYVHQLAFREANPIDSPAWSLEVEVQFYLIVPLLSVLFASRRRALRRATIVALACLSAVYQWSGGLANDRMLSFVGDHLQFFLAGWLLADVYLVDWNGRPSLRRSWDVVSLLGWPALFAGLVWWPPFRITLGPIAGALLFCAAFRGPLTRRALTNPWLTAIGGMCYSIYLLHYPIELTLGRWTQALSTGNFGADVLLQTVVLLPIVLFVSTIFFLLVERPCMDPTWPSRVRERVQGAARLMGNRELRLRELLAPQPWITRRARAPVGRSR